MLTAQLRPRRRDAAELHELRPHPRQLRAAQLGEVVVALQEGDHQKVERAQTAAAAAAAAAATRVGCTTATATQAAGRCRQRCGWCAMPFEIAAVVFRELGASVRRAVLCDAPLR